MEAARALKITQALLMKTTANGCTPSEAAAASTRAAAYIRRFSFTLEETNPDIPKTLEMKQPHVDAIDGMPLFPPSPVRWRSVMRRVGGVVGGFGLLCLGYILW